MKRAGSIAVLIMTAIMMFSSICFGAEAFTVESTTPEDGATNTTKDNMCVKVYFSAEVGNKASKEKNKDMVSIKEKGGRKFPTRIFYSDKNPKYVLIAVDTDKTPRTGKKAVKDNKEYVCTIEKGFVANNGAALAEDVKITFKTMNQKRNTAIYMVMMVAMMGGMFWFTAKQTKKQKEEEAEGIKEKEEAFNPYKEAKKTGKSLEEVIAQHNKDMEKKRKKAKEEGKAPEPVSDEPIPGHYRVPRPRKISEAGVNFKSGKKAAMEEAERKEAERKAALKAEGYGKKQKNKDAGAASKKKGGKKKK